MEYLAMHSELTLADFCRRLSTLLELPDFQFDSENETEWGESQDEYLKVNVSRPYEKGTLQEWDDTVPIGCNFGISITKDGVELNEIMRIGKLIADDFRTSIFYHRTWLELGNNIKREIEIKTSYNNG